MQQPGYGPGVDLFQFGLMLLELCCCRPLAVVLQNHFLVHEKPPQETFQGTDLVKYLDLLCVYMRTTLLQRLPLPQSLIGQVEDLVRRCLVVDPERRITAAEACIDTHFDLAA
ncbi:hypothetical protein PAPYR_604 [Paratrimastix pyriformis]|uniref:Protein kinase domain-containing protein n=1 Tax=Paratrimastix pyriformis TaxID=342808 RepID=A0ABQ8UU11_9EUKA|nr:hypothetical protein PAPYR_604 [Paratrimastix pyriformis]